NLGLQSRVRILLGEDRIEEAIGCRRLVGRRSSCRVIARPSVVRRRTRCNLLACLSVVRRRSS
ncbi:MAG TPA: hypothetical protein VEJ87_07680, partial [Acidimicrobiales bacterium]|nr:hypothetical protein [Acidimicrobiales bacterium]